MAHWLVVERERDFFLSGPNAPSDVWLFLRLDAGDITTDLSNPDDMHRALYDEYQVNEFMRDGDTIATPVGTFYCYSVHVLSQTEYDKLLSKP